MKIELVQSVQQQQILAPQMILSMDILLLTTQELETRIEKEFMENPALEIEENVAAEEETKNSDDRTGAEDTLFQQLEDFQNLPSVNWFESGRRRNYSSNGGEYDRQEMLQSLEGAPPGLREYLTQQLHLLGLPARPVEIGEFIINNIDDRGYLLHTAASLRDSLADEVTEKEFNEALALVRALDPSGVGAESLQECLLLQLERDAQPYPLEIEILRNHVDDLQKNKIPKIAGDLGKTVEDIKDALELISMLQPYPGREYSPSPRQFIRPDVVVEFDEDHKLRIRVQDGDIPDLRISESCRNLLTESRGRRDVTSFLRKKIDSAQWLIQAIEQRRRTLYDITTAILEYQRNFIDQGPQHLRAMKMQTIADIVGVHISTTSRAIKGKYIQTPFGLFELRYFFTGGVERGDGEVESRRNVYRRIAELIANENKSKPLSDTAIANQLKKEGLDIARRTVTKYRDQEKIPPSRLRKVY